MLKLLVCSVSDDKAVQGEDWVVCQHPECPDRRRASKVRPSPTTRRAGSHRCRPAIMWVGPKINREGFPELRVNQVNPQGNEGFLTSNTGFQAERHF